MIDETPRIVIHPGRVGGTPTIGESRIPAAMVAGTYWCHGADETKMMWPGLTDAEILVCCWFVAHHGTRTEKKRWREWRDHADIMLWSRETIRDCDWPSREEAA